MDVDAAASDEADAAGAIVTDVDADAFDPDDDGSAELSGQPRMLDSFNDEQLPLAPPVDDAGAPEAAPALRGRRRRAPDAAADAPAPRRVHFAPAPAHAPLGAAVSGGLVAAGGRGGTSRRGGRAGGSRRGAH